MSEPKEPTREALAVGLALCDDVHRGDSSHFAQRLDAWGEALLRRQAKPDDTRFEREAERCHLMSRERDKWRERHTEERYAHAATKAELAETEQQMGDAYKRCEFERDQARAGLEAISKELGAYKMAAIVGQRDLDAAKSKLAELESLRKPLEGELAWDAKRVREYLLLPPEAEPETLEAFDRIEAALRAKGEPQAAEPPEPRPIVLRSIVLRSITGEVIWQDPEPAAPAPDASACYCSEYQSSGCSCPPGKCPNVPAATAPELPRKVEGE